MIWIILIAAFIYLAVEFGQYLLIFLAITAVVTAITLMIKAESDSNDVKEIEYTILLGRTRIMETRTRPSGFSISSRGNVRGYWKFKDEVARIDADFEVHYKNGDVRRIKAVEGSNKCNTLYAYIGKPKKKQAEEKKIIKEEQPKIAESPKLLEVPRAEAPEELKQERKDDAKKQKKYYLDVPFEIAPNEYGLTVSYPSCQVENMDDGGRRIYVMFTATYDSTVKGLKNRVISCSIINRDGRTMDVSRYRKVLDSSGSMMIDITYWHKIYEEPAKVVVGIDRYN